jgi:hypothetical protein
MNRRIVFWTLLSLLRINTELAGQTLDSWKNFIFLAGLDTASCSGVDSLEVSRKAHQLAYGTPVAKNYSSLIQKIDSGRINTVVSHVLRDSSDWQAQLRSLEPTFEPYRLMRRKIDSLAALNADSLLPMDLLRSTLNEYRVINRTTDEVLIIVNIPSASLKAIDRQGNILLRCPVIVGRPGTPTPIFSAYLTRVITYPYWNVPRSIAVNEFLPKIKRNPEDFLDAMKMQVLDIKGQIVPPLEVDWKSLSARNFPYRLRQSTGCDNALGVIKFDLESPYDVYLHDTNHRELFGKKNRFLSHGCIRVSEPVKLANLLMQEEFLDDSFTQSQNTGLPSKSYPLPRKVPVIITYLTAEADTDKGLIYYNDIYNKSKSF